MIDRAKLASELQQARMARIEAESAWCDIEDMLWAVRQGPRGWRRIGLADLETAEPPAASR